MGQASFKEQREIAKQLCPDLLKKLEGLEDMEGLAPPSSTGPIWLREARRRIAAETLCDVADWLCKVQDVEDE